MLQRLTRRNPLSRIKACHGTYKVFKVIVDTIPEHERLSRGLLVESVPSHLENANPRIITKILQELSKPVKICKVRDLAFNYDSEWINALFQLIFSNCENYALVNGPDALTNQLPAELKNLSDRKTYDKSK